MPNYSKTGPFSNGGAPGISAAFLNNIENVFVQPSGGTELGKYWLEGNAYVVGAYVTCFIPSLSRGATPVSVSIDTADQSVVGMNAPGTYNLTSSGFHISANANGGAQTNMYCGGNTTIHY